MKARNGVGAPNRKNVAQDHDLRFSFLRFSKRSLKGHAAINREVLRRRGLMSKAALIRRDLRGGR